MQETCLSKEHLGLLADLSSYMGISCIPSLKEDASCNGPVGEFEFLHSALSRLYEGYRALLVLIRTLLEVINLALYPP